MAFAPKNSASRIPLPGASKSTSTSVKRTASRQEHHSSQGGNSPKSKESKENTWGFIAACDSQIDAVLAAVHTPPLKPSTPKPGDEAAALPPAVAQATGAAAEDVQNAAALAAVPTAARELPIAARAELERMGKQLMVLASSQAAELRSPEEVLLCGLACGLLLAAKPSPKPRSQLAVMACIVALTLLLMAVAAVVVLALKALPQQRVPYS